MAAFEYLALARTGKMEKGVLTGDSAKAVRSELRASGLTPLEVEPVHDASSTKRGSSVSSAQKRSGRQKMSSMELAVMTRGRNAPRMTGPGSANRP